VEKREIILSKEEKEKCNNLVFLGRNFFIRRGCVFVKKVLILNPSLEAVFVEKKICPEKRGRIVENYCEKGCKDFCKKGDVF
jgi:hypothetical protein